MTPPDQERRKLDIPDRRQNTYEDLEKALNQKLDEHIEAHEKALEKHEKALTEHAERLEDRLSRFFSKALVAFAVIGMISAISIFGFGVVLREFQNQRKAFVRITCEDQNERHDNTTDKLTKLAQADIDSRKTEAGKEEVRRRRDVTIGLIDALAPHQDCDALVEQAINESADRASEEEDK